MKKYIHKIAFWTNLLCAVALLLSYASSLISPKFFWQLAFFGLFYPVFLILNGVFVLFWAWRKSWLILISAVTIGLGWGYIGRYFQLNLFGPEKDQFEFTSILSYNVHLFNYYNWKGQSLAQNDVLNLISEQNPQIVCFQEFLTVIDTKRNTEKEIDSMLGFLPFKHTNYIHQPNAFSNYGIATYSMHPIINKGIIRFRDSYNSCIYSDIVIKKDTVRVFNVHLQSIKLRKNSVSKIDSLTYTIPAEGIDDVRDISGRLKTGYLKRAQQVKLLRSYIEKSPYPVIVCGDFNDTPVSYTYQQARGKLRDAFIGSGKGLGNTFQGQFPFFRIDFIFHSSKFKSFNYKTYQVKFSDHYPISCSLFKD